MIRFPFVTHVCSIYPIRRYNLVGYLQVLGSRKLLQMGETVDSNEGRIAVLERHLSGAIVSKNTESTTVSEISIFNI